LALVILIEPLFMRFMEVREMAKPNVTPRLVDLLDKTVKTMQPNEIKMFRAELVRRLPETINQAAQAAREQSRQPTGEAAK
jgi:hypothetical protein